MDEVEKKSSTLDLVMLDKHDSVALPNEILGKILWTLFMCSFF